MGLRVLITGGAGFLGQWLHQRLSEDGHAIWAPSSAELDVRDSVTCRDWVGKVSPQWVFHLAALTKHLEVQRFPDRCMEVASRGTRNLLEALGSAVETPRVVVVSSCHAYGPPQSLPVTEEHPLLPSTVYGRAKLAQEQVAEEFGELDVVVARPFHLVGPGQDVAFAAADWAQQNKEGVRQISVGRLDLERDYLDVRDAAVALTVLAARGERGEVYNICRGEAVSLEWVFGQVVDSGTPHLDVERVREVDAPTIIGDPSRLLALGWKPQVSVESSLADLVDRL